jgi:drug/metabolite transporter (DMT)-like permease
MFGATLLFGINYWVAKGLMPLYLKPLQIIFLRIAGALVLIWIMELLSPIARKSSVRSSDFPRLAIAALLGIALNQILFFTGLNLTTPVDSAIINSTNPMMVLILSLIFMHKKVKSLNIVGIFLGAAGALILIIYRNPQGSSIGSLAGNLYIFANTLCWSMYLVIIKPLTIKYHPYVITRWVFLFGFLFALPFTIQPVLRIHFSGFTIHTLGAITYVIVGTTFLAYLFITFGLRKLSPSIVAFYTYLQPVIVAIIGIVIFSEIITLEKILAAGLVFLGIYLVNKKSD